MASNWVEKLNDPANLDKDTVEKILLSKSQSVLSRFSLVENSGSSSECWKKFRRMVFDGHTIDKFAICVGCKTVHSSPKGSSTAGLNRHRCLSTTFAKGQLTLPQSQNTRLILSDSEKRELKKAQTLAVVQGHLSFATMENAGVLNLIQTCVNIAVKHNKQMDVRDALYSRVTISRNLNSMVPKITAAVSERLQRVARMKALSCTIDLTTEKHTRRAYLDIHAIWEEDYKIFNVPVCVQAFPPVSHTGAAILSETTRVLASFGLDPNEISFVTDEGSNVVSAFGQALRLACFAHRLHTVHKDMKNALRADTQSGFDEYVEGTKQLTALFNQTTGLQEQLPMTLKRGPDTRTWTAMYDRALSIETSYDQVVAILVERGQSEILLQVNRDVNKDVLKFTAVTKRIFEDLQADTVPTLQYVVPGYYALSNLCKPRSDDSRILGNMKEAFIKALDLKYFNSIKALHYLATYLDPSYKSYSFVPERTAADRTFKQDLLRDLKRWLKSFLEECQQILDNTREPANVDHGNDQPSPEKQPRLENDPMETLRSFGPAPDPGDDSSDTPNVALEKEMGEYAAFMLKQAPPRKFDPLKDFWSLHDGQWPILALAARRIFAIPASSASSERDFSGLKLTVTEKRASLDPGTVNAAEIVQGALKSGIMKAEDI